MTMRDTDSESQDSDDGRRFRFETTRKDIGVSVERKSVSPRRESKHTSHSRHHHRNKDESRYNDSKEIKSKTMKHEDNKYRNYRERAKDTRRHKNYDKDRKHKRRSRDRSHDRSKCHSWSRSRDRSRSPRHKSREEHKKHGSSRKEDKNKSEHREHREEKNVSQISYPSCKDTDLTDYNVLLETENLSDISDEKRSSSVPNSPARKKFRKEITIDKNEELKECTNLGNHSPLPNSSNSEPNKVLDILAETESMTPKYTEAFEDAKQSKSKDENIDSSVEVDEFTYGPSLPPRYSKELSNKTKDADSLVSLPNVKENSMLDDKIEKDSNFIGPCLPQTNVLGRSNEDQEKEISVNENQNEDEVDVFGPALPPHLKQKPTKAESHTRVIGPSLPDGIELSIESTNPEFSESEPEDAIGPLPPDHPALRSSYVHEQLERRAERIKHELREEVDTSNNREEWMTELPPAQSVHLGLSARKFRINPGPDMSDRSCWTDTPAQKAQKQRKKETKEAFNVKDSNKVDVKEYEEVDKSRKHTKSLLETHQEKMKKKKKAKEKEAKLTGESTRRPFDRDVDLQINRVNSSQKKSIIMKAQRLDDRFTRGGM